MIKHSLVSFVSLAHVIALLCNGQEAKLLTEKKQAPYWWAQQSTEAPQQTFSRLEQLEQIKQESPFAIFFIVSENCPHCICMKPIIDDVRKKFENIIVIESITSDEAKKLAIPFDGYPTHIYYKRGKQMHREVGSRSLEQVLGYVNQYLFNLKDAHLIENKVEKELATVLDIVVVGAGPAGIAAATYAARNQHSCVLFAGPKPMGQLGEVERINNWPGKHQYNGGYLANSLHVLAKKEGVLISPESITHIDFHKKPFALTCQNGKKLKAKTIILAMGITPKKLDAEGADIFWGKTITPCAICDAATYKGKVTVVVGGDEHAAQEVLQLANQAKKVYLITPDSTLSMPQPAQERITKNANVTILYNTRITSVSKNNNAMDITLEGASTEKKLTVDGIFVALGGEPNTELIKNDIKLTTHGFVHLKHTGQETSRAGVYAAGDIGNPEIRQAVIAYSQGLQAGIQAAERVKTER